MSTDPISTHQSEPSRFAASSRGFREVWEITESDADYPQCLLQYRDTVETQTLYGLGDRGILRRECLGLVCSVKCPGSVIIKTFDAVRELRDVGIVLAGGFHSPMEKECLDFLLRGKQPVIICLARYPKRSGLTRRWQTAIDNGQVLLLSTFGPRWKRTSRQASFTRNLLVASLSKATLVPYTSSGGMAEQVVEQCLAENFHVITFQDEANAQMLQRGVGIYSFDEVKRLFTV